MLRNHLGWRQSGSILTAPIWAARRRRNYDLAYRAWLSNFDAPSDKSVTLEYVDADNMYLWLPITPLYWLRWTWQKDGAHWYPETGQVWDAIDAVNDDDVGITYGGINWATGTRAGQLGASEHRAKSADKTATWTITGYSDLYISISKLNNSGYTKPTIDGAQTLLATDDLEYVSGEWVINGYSAVTATHQLIKLAENLNPATTYTIELRTKGTKQDESSDTYIYFEGYGQTCADYMSAGDVTADTRYVSIGPIVAGSGQVVSYQPTGATGAELAGDAGHGNTALTSAAWTDSSGDPITVDGGTTQASSAFITLSQVYTLRHSETGATDNATVTRASRFDYIGLHETMSIAWAVAAAISYAYTGMMPSTDDNSDRGIVAGDPAGIYDLSADDDVLHGKLDRSVSLLWDTGHDFVTAVDVTRGGEFGGYKHHIEDKSAGNNKIYPMGYYGRSAAISDTWTLTWRHWVALITNVETYI